MHLELRLPHAPVSQAPNAAQVADAVRRGLHFALARHAARTRQLIVELRGPRHAGAGWACTIEGEIDPLGACRVGGDGFALHEALEHALHRLEMRLVEHALATTPPAEAA